MPVRRGEPKIAEATDQPDDLSGYRETPARRVLLVEGRQACYGDKRAFEAAGNERYPVADRRPRTRQWQRCAGRIPTLAASGSSPPLRRTKTTTTRERRPSAMARQKPAKGEPAKQVAIDLLRTAGEPLHAKEIAKRVIESGRTRLKGKTPEATITAMLAVGSKPGGEFKRVDKGTYTLDDAPMSATNAGPKQNREAQPRPQKRQAAKPAA